MTERPLAEELSRIAGHEVTRWKATQFKKHHAAEPAAEPAASLQLGLPRRILSR